MMKQKAEAETCQALYVALARTHNQLLARVSETLKPHGLTEPQFNILRTLRGAGREGLNVVRIWERMLTRVPDMTRLLDRLERAGWVSRERSGTDRRTVIVRITPEGRALLKGLDAAVRRLHGAMFASLSPAERMQLAALLDKLSPES